MSAWACARCGRPDGRRGFSSICAACRAQVAAAGLTWCPQCRRAVDPAQVSAGICLPCHSAARRRLRRAESAWSCARCQRFGPRHGPSDLCDACRAALRAEGRFWCRGCKRALPAAERCMRGACYDCERRRSRVRRGTEPPPGYVDLRTASARLHLCKRALSERCRAGKVPGAIRVPRYWWIPESYQV